MSTRNVYAERPPSLKPGQYGGRADGAGSLRFATVVNFRALCHNPALSLPGRFRAAVAAITLNPEQNRLSGCSPRASNRLHEVQASPCAAKESQMPKGYKLKTKSGAKKRFKITGTGKVKYQQSGKRHGMIKRTTKTIREHRGTAVLFKTDGDNVKKYWMPNG
jgi:large subunit ribosomal protein L35